MRERVGNSNSMCFSSFWLFFFLVDLVESRVLCLCKMPRSTAVRTSALTAAFFCLKRKRKHYPHPPPHYLSP